MNINWDEPYRFVPIFCTIQSNTLKQDYMPINIMDEKFKTGLGLVYREFDKETGTFALLAVDIHDRVMILNYSLTGD